MILQSYPLCQQAAADSLKSRLLLGSEFSDIVPGVFTPVLAKHSKSFSLNDCISVGVDRMQRNFEPMRKQVEAWQGSDKTRIYANGMSNGGGMAFVLSCTMSDRIAAVGMVSAGLYPEWNWCTDHRPVPVIAFHGTADPICPYKGGASKLGGGTFPNVPDFMANWSRRNRCGPNPTESAVAADVTRPHFPPPRESAPSVLLRPSHSQRAFAMP